MRVGIDYRILALGPELVTRGVGAYTQRQLREVLAADGGNEYILLCDRATDLSLIDPRIRDAANVDIRCYSAPRGADPADPGELLRRVEHYQAWVFGRGIDVYHATAPLLPGPPLVRFDVCALVTTLHDLPGAGTPDGHALRLLGRPTRVLAVSDAVRAGAASLLGIPTERIDRAWPVPGEAFRVLPARLLDKLLLILRSRMRVPERFVLTAGDPDHVLHLAPLLRGYAELPAGMRAGLPLVLSCLLDAEGAATLRDLGVELGISDDLVVTGPVSDEELCALYNQATLVVAAWPSEGPGERPGEGPSEGFGLPIAEAMRCGCSVVTTTAPALAEVSGDAAVRVDAGDPHALAAAIADLAGDPSRREELAGRGLEHAARFDGAQLAAATLESYRRAAEAPLPPRRGGRRIAVWTPLPPLPTGIADYAAELLECLEPRCDLEVFVDGGYLPSEDLLERHDVHHFSAFERRAARLAFDAVVYQIGASPFHAYMSDALATHPGIVALHDLIWGNVLYAAHNDAGDLQTFHRRLAELYGEGAVRELAGLDFRDQEAAWDFFGRHPMLEPVIGDSLAQVVHFEAAAEELSAVYPNARPHVVPMGVDDPLAALPGVDTASARVGLGLGAERFIVGIFGSVHRLKKVEVAISALAGLVFDGIDAQLVVVGPGDDYVYADELAKLARRLGIAAHISFTGHVPKESFDAHLIACDVVVNLRARAHKHMSAIIVRAIAAARPVVITDLPEWRFLPDAFCRRIPTDGEVPALVAALRALAGDPEGRARMSAAARAFYEEEGTVEHMATRYLDVVEEVCGRTPWALRGYNPPVPRPERAWT